MTYNTDWSLEVENREFVLFSNFVNCQPSIYHSSLPCCPGSPPLLWFCFIWFIRAGMLH